MHKFVSRPRVARALSGAVRRTAPRERQTPARVQEQKVARTFSTKKVGPQDETPTSHVDLQQRAVDMGSLYDPANEKGSCGVGFVANFKCNPSHLLVRDALEMLERMEHRGAVGFDPDSGDGAGILV